MERKRPFVLVIILVIIVIGISLSYIIVKHKSASANKNPLKTITISKGDIQSKVHALGSVDSAETKIVKADASERIQDVNVSVGTKVKKDQALITFLNHDLQESINQAKNDLQMSVIDVDSAKRDIEESNANHTINSTVTGKVVEVDGVIGENIQPDTVLAVIQDSHSKKVNITSKSSGKLASFQIKTGDNIHEGASLAVLDSDPSLLDKEKKANIQLQEAKNKLNQLLDEEKVEPIKSPFDGTVVAEMVKAGDDIQKGDSLLEIADLTHMQMTLPVDELDISKVKLGQNVKVSLNALSGTPIMGKVDYISEVGELKNGVSTFLVTISLNETEGVKVGMTGEADIITSEKKNILVLPLGAIQEKNGHQFVLVENNDGKQVMTKIKTGIHDDSYVEIISGLNEGDKVVLPKSYTLQKSKNKKKNGALKKMFGGNKSGKQK